MVRLFVSLSSSISSSPEAWAAATKVWLMAWDSLLGDRSCKQSEASGVVPD